MKNQNGKDTKKAAANDKDVKVEERYTLGNIATVRRGSSWNSCSSWRRKERLQRRRW